MDKIILHRVSIRKYQPKAIESENGFVLVSCGYPAEVRAQQNRYDVDRVHYVE